ncbi:GntP family gluconate:H+ symporter/Gnt-I system low-affinity gluconate transporter [Alkalihalobacillus xiaoxiensis]|uniref:GntP family gluconate:H+ symporter/Gnt-I system low-affinity gluconate transporter n=1 Tax=Shouchella xiaoxiensis TaxID=766895 RepID=A0ABS2SYV0_9BACI|nr:gluconate:H+ symporter [Shouchella xiaoxiensis]MBM7840709.1 GntP family gluconate:H+ symporter/Gnt-I system low-affinity gluconate transporter [Shouchella xiaoxiensis]
MSSLGLILVTIVGIAVLLYLIMHSKMQAFLALLIASIFIGIFTGMDPTSLIETMEEGMGGTLGFIAIVVGLGAMFGEMLRTSGGAERLAFTLVDRFGENRAQWALALTGFIVAIPVFLDVALVILLPIVYSLAMRTGKSLLYYAIPLLAGLAVAHSFIPPTPGPIAVASVLGVDLGWMMLFGIIAGLPAMIIAGPLFGRWIGKRVHVGVPAHIVEATKQEEESKKELPRFGLICFIILLPLAMILLNTAGDVILKEGTTTHQILTFVGHPFIALIVATLLAMYFLGKRRGATKEQIQTMTTKALEPAGIVILITGAGGVFKEVLIQSGVGDAMGELMASSGFPLVLLAFLIATFVRVAQGSATVAMITAAGLVSPIIDMVDLSQPSLALIAIAIACGATVLSHVNDSGFWLVSRFLEMSEKDTLKSWTVMETIIGGVGFLVVFGLSFFFS